MRYNICDCCNRYDELHIGKSSYGWSFTFHEVNEFDFPIHKMHPKNALIGEENFVLTICSYSEWKNFINDFVINYKTALIYDEYGEEIQVEDFYRKIEEKRSGKSHAEDVQDDHAFLDEEGNSFISGEFR